MDLGFVMVFRLLFCCSDIKAGPLYLLIMFLLNCRAIKELYLASNKIIFSFAVRRFCNGLKLEVLV
jgi:hypothetical protein